MRPTVRISFGPAEVIAPLPENDRRWSADQGRRWLDEKFTAYECEPLRAMGKVLTADKLLALAAEIGHDAFAADEALRTDYARGTRRCRPVRRAASGLASASVGAEEAIWVRRS
jgi:hypothetical protein